MERSLQNRRLAGLAGLLGALLFFCGDMLFYGHVGSGASFHEGMQHVAREASLARLFIGGLLGPIAALEGDFGQRISKTLRTGCG
jgi:hypothetical protein